MARPHRGTVVGRFPRYLRTVIGPAVRGRLLFLVGVALVFAFPLLGWWAVVVGLAAIAWGAYVRRS
jgi:hypothetical protein